MLRLPRRLRGSDLRDRCTPGKNNSEKRICLSHAHSGLTLRSIAEIRRMLLKKGLVARDEIAVPDESTTLLKFTDEGCALPASRGIKLNPLPKNTSLEHEYWKKLVAEDYKARRRMVEEKVHIGCGKAVDIVATKGDERIVIEIGTVKLDIGQMSGL